MVPPEAGDAVSFQCEGKVDSADGQMVTVTVEMINGQPVQDTMADIPLEQMDEGALESGLNNRMVEFKEKGY